MGPFTPCVSSDSRKWAFTPDRGLTAQEPQVQPALPGTASPLLCSHHPSPYSCLRNLGCGLRLLHGPELSEASACQLIAFLGLTFICPGPWKCCGLCIWDVTSLVQYLLTTSRLRPSAEVLQCPWSSGTLSGSPRRPAECGVLMAVSSVPADAQW